MRLRPSAHQASHCFLAPLHLAGGADAIFLLTPIAGGLVVWLTFQLGAQVAGAWAGVVAARDGGDDSRVRISARATDERYRRDRTLDRGRRA